LSNDVTASFFISKDPTEPHPIAKKQKLNFIKRLIGFYQLFPILILLPTELFGQPYFCFLYIADLDSVCRHGIIQIIVT
jgi:hypothetical protein